MERNEQASSQPPGQRADGRTLIRQRVEVAFDYPVHFTRELFSPDNPILQRLVAGPDGAPDGVGATGPARLLVVLDAEVARLHPTLPDAIAAYCRHHARKLTLVAPPLRVPGGEQVKNDPAHVTAVHAAVDRFGLDRQSFVMAVGGGAVLDMVGYAAATAHRGVRLIRVPTTVLSQNDSAVGVKNSVNAFGKKNFLGTFAPPFAVLNDAAFLRTLSQRDWLAGCSEAVKVALLKDPAFFAALEANAPALVARDEDAMAHLVYRCAELHLEHIATSGDPFEFGSSRPLDFGHWAAHKLEQVSGYELRHGEAVAIGIALDATYAKLAGMLDEVSWRRVIELFTALELPIFACELTRDLDDTGTPGPGSVLRGLEEFREHLGGRLTVMLLEGIGRGVEVHHLDEALIVEAIHTLERLQDRTGVAA